MFKILKKISVRVNEKMLPRRKYTKSSLSLIHISRPDRISFSLRVNRTHNSGGALAVYAPVKGLVGWK
jgi:hypothetical protein